MCFVPWASFFRSTVWSVVSVFKKSWNDLPGEGFSRVKKYGLELDKVLKLPG
jgi:hypothetical protein